ncbi:hypothetical protein BD410DRAFT_745395 [Rickenella mellea]|uniref:ribonuclease Z n=1 Tax=Rickenella mellea TaxID=50990 RepID=A0A4Y7QB45_9AGAM|nr:hypothetical protein BD410DRAFT_745395 [Rickenella mellea]
MNWSVNVLSSVSSDTEPTIVVTFDSAKYIFNVGENTTRAFLQSPRGWRKAKSIFLTGICTDRSAGLPGFLMTLADSGLKEMSVIGPEGLLHFLASARLYTYRDNMDVTAVEFPYNNTQPVFKDENIVVSAIAVQPTINHVSPEEVINATPTSGKRKRSNSPMEGSRKQPRPFTEATHASSSQLSTAKAVGKDMMTLFRSASFSATNLGVSEAKEWRKITVQHMFGSSAVNDVERRAKKNASPASCYQRLPAWRSRHPNLDNGTLEAGFAFGRTVSSFIVHAHRPRGKFDAKKASALGLGPGPLRARLAKGEAVEIKVTTENGGEVIRTIQPADCMGIPDKAGTLIIVDCPTPDYIDGLLASPVWSDYQPQDGVESEYTLQAVFHLVGDGVLEDPRYVQWMRSFGDTVHHFVGNKMYCPDRTTFTSHAFHQLHLHHLDAKMFPMPHYNLEPKNKLTSILNLPKNTQPLLANHLISMRPVKAPVIDLLSGERDTFHIALQNSSSPPSVSYLRDQSASAEEDVTIVPLGTSSATPSKYRNVSSTLVQIPRYGNILLDCGEGTWGQLQRHFGTDPMNSTNVFDTLRHLRCIFISHLHADHHIGLSRILAMRQRLHPKPAESLYLAAHYPVHLYLKEYSDLEDLGMYNTGPGGVRPILNNAIHWQRPVSTDTDQFQGRKSDWVSMEQSELAAAELRKQLGLRTFKTVNVAHRVKCFGLVMEHDDGWSVVFSGDTMPSDNLVEAGKGATLLIHEATMADDQADLAKAKAHSTFGEAIDVGKRMNAKNILLTHFSARYPKIPPLQETSLDDPTVVLAWEHSRLPLKSMAKFREHLPAMEQIFSSTASENEQDGTT